MGNDKYDNVANTIVMMTNATGAILSTIRLHVFLKNCPSKEIFEMVECFFLVRT